MATTTASSIPAGMENFVVGIIGMGDMGKMYARRLSDAGWKIMACDKEDQYEELCQEFSSRTNIQILRNGHLVSRASDYIIYSVEAAVIDRVVAQYGPSTKLNAIVGGQTSCKDPEIKAFEEHLPSDVDIVSCHSLHGPGVDSRDQPLVLIKHRASDASFEKVETVLRCLQSKHVYLTAHEHDRITADTQAVTHAAFLSMGKAWHAMRQFPWEGARYVGGIENVKINLMLRIYSQKWHVYAGLAILNPEARKQIDQYAKSVTELYKLMLGGHRDELRARVLAAKEKVFGPDPEEEDVDPEGEGDGEPEPEPEGEGEGESKDKKKKKKWADQPPLLLRDEVLDQFTLRPAGAPQQRGLNNNHLSLLAMVDCWSALGIVPYEHMICSTPLFRLWLGVTEHLFRRRAALDHALAVALDDATFRPDDLEFTFAARGWAECVRLGHFDTWRERFVETQRFFQPRFPAAVDVGNRMVRAVLESTKS
ncbi:prephenate dehydrogenase [Biscogniauxia sp. FL1348]|nr:prephenate dehydrogenase [Biscogniauxia sp. FL1348]